MVISDLVLGILASHVRGHSPVVSSLPFEAFEPLLRLLSVLVLFLSGYSLSEGGPLCGVGRSGGLKVYRGEFRFCLPFFVFAKFSTFAFGAFSRSFALAVVLAVVSAVTVVIQVGDPSLFPVSGAHGSLFFGAAHAGVFSRVVVGYARGYQHQT